MATPRSRLSSREGPRSPISRTKNTDNVGKQHSSGVTSNQSRAHDNTQLPAINSARKETGAKTLRALVSNSKTVSAANFSKMPPLMKLTKIKISLLNGLFCMIRRKIARTKYINMVHSTLLVQRVHRGHKERATHHRTKAIVRLSAVLIRTLVLRSSSVMIAKAVSIQSCFRGHTARVKVRLGFTPRWEAAAIYIQRRFRGSLTRMIANQTATVRELPAAMILASMALRQHPSLFRINDPQQLQKLILQTQRAVQLAKKFPKNLERTNEEVESIFRALDVDSDGVLNESDLHLFSVRAGIDLCKPYLKRFACADEARGILLGEFVIAYRQTADFFRSPNDAFQKISSYVEDAASREYYEFMWKINHLVQKLTSMQSQDRCRELFALDVPLRNQVLLKLGRDNISEMIHLVHDEDSVLALKRFLLDSDQIEDQEQELFRRKIQAEQKLSTAHFTDYLKLRSPNGGSGDEANEVSQHGFSLFRHTPHVLLMQEAHQRSAVAMFARLEIQSAVREGDMLFEKALKLMKRGLFEQACEAMEKSPICFEYARTIEEEGNIFYDLKSDLVGWEGELSLAADVIRVRDPSLQHRYSKIQQMRILLRQRMKEALRGPGPAHFAAAKGNVGTLRYLVSKCGESIDAIDRIGRTPLHLAVEERQYETVRILIEELKADVTSVTFVGRTPLHLAADLGDEKMVQLLIESVAYCCHMDANNESSRENIMMKAMEACAATEQTYHGNTALSLACNKAHFRVTEIFEKLNMKNPSNAQDYLGKNLIFTHSEPCAPYCPAHHLSFSDGHLQEDLLEHYKYLDTMQNLNLALKRPMTASSQNSRPNTADTKASAFLRSTKLASYRGKFKLEVGVVSAKDILAADRCGTSDPYVEILYQGMVLKTKVIFKTLSPAWDETFKLEIDPGGDLDWNVVEFRIWDHNVITERTFLGIVLIDISDLTFQPTELWYEIQDSEELRGRNLLNPRNRLKYGKIQAPPPITGTLCVRLQALNPISHLPLPPKTTAREMFEEERLYPLHLEHPGLTEAQVRARLAIEWEEGGVNLQKQCEEKLSKARAEFRYSLGPHFLAACVQNDMHTIRYCCEHGVDVEVTNDKAFSGLHLAAHKGNTEAVQALLSARAQVNAQAKSGATPLYQACVQGHVDAARVLIAHGADLELAAPNGLTALMMCAHRGVRDTLELLLQSGARIEACNDKGATALHLAALAGKAECVAALMRSKANPRAKITSGDLEGHTPKDLARDKPTLDAFKTKPLR